MQSPATSGHVESLSGSTLKGYALLERIGAGGFGAVYRAVQSTIDREVALKIILPGWSNNPAFIRRFEAEAQIIARLEHPHIVPLYDYWRDPSGAYLVMRYLRGGSVRDALREGPYTLEQTSRLVDQVAAALDLAHRHHVIHRDLKPGNILLDEDGNAYLSDFGIATDLTGGSEGFTAPSGVIGSLDYLSPEQARGEAVTPQTDIYCLGVTLYEMLTGQHPFPGDSPVELLYHHINDPLPRIDLLDPAVGEALNAVIQTATAKAPIKRYPDVLALAAALRDAVGRGDTSHELQVIEQLTLREHEVLQLIAQGLSNREVADRLYVTVATVRWHIRRLYKTLGVSSRVQAIVRARELDLIATDAVGAGDVPASSPSAIALPEPENPYKGLRAFQVGDAPDFFGREAFVARLIERMNDRHPYHRFLAIVGPSGSGKSSLVRAGLIPALWRGAIPGSERWFIVDMVPGVRPLDQLEVALVRVAANQAGNLRQQLARDSYGLLRAANLILPHDGTELVLVVDQFEELFTLPDDDLRAHFLALLHAAVVDPRSRMRVVVTLRADYYDRPLHYPEFGELLHSRMETLLPLSAQGLEQAILGPAQRARVVFEPGLVAQIVSEMHYQAGALPLLQYALTELFTRRAGRVLTHAAYAAIGGAVGALANRADEIFFSLDDRGRELTRQMFLRLVTLGDRAESSRRRVPRSELQALDDADLTEEIVEAFVAYRLIALDHEPDTRRPIVELAHEALLREWGRLRDWLEESRHDVEQQRVLAAAADEWSQAGDDASYLLRGAKLAQLASWAAETTLALTPRERDFLTASVRQRTEDAALERERQDRELRLARDAADSAQTAAVSQRRAAQRLRYLVVGLGIFLIAAIALSLFAFGERSNADNARATSDFNALDARSSAAQAREWALVNRVQAALAQDDLDTALALAVAANSSPHPSAQVQRVLSEAAYRPGPVRTFSGAAAGPLRVAFSSDARTILSGGLDGVGYVWDAASGALLHRLEGHTNWIVDVGISPDNRTGFTLGRDLTIILWDLETGQELRHFGRDLIVGPEMLAAAFTPDGRSILSNNGGGAANDPEAKPNLILWDVATGRPVRTLRGHTAMVGRLAVSPDGRTALSGALRGEMILWDLATGAVLRRFGEDGDDERKVPSDIVFSPDGRSAYVKGMDGVVVAWDLEAFTARYRLGEALANENWAWTQLAISPDGRWLATQRTSGPRVQIWDALTGTAVGELLAQSAAVAFGPDGRSLLAGAASAMHLWDLTGGAEVRRFELALPVFGIALSPDGSTLFAASAPIMNGRPQPCEFVLFEVSTGKTLHIFRLEAGETDAFGCILWSRPVYSPDGRTVLAGVDERVIAWDAASGERLVTFSGHSASVTSIAVSPDGHSALSGDVSGQIFLWDRATGQEIRRMEGHSASVSDLRFGPTGQTALSASQDGTVREWDLATGGRVREFAGTGSPITSLDLSPDRRTVVIYDASGRISLWDYASGQPLRSLVSALPGGEVRFTPDGRSLITNQGELWDLAEGEVVRRYPSGDDLVIGPDGHSFFLTVWQPVPAAVQWRIDALDQLLTWTLSHRAVRELTCEERRSYQLGSLCDAAGGFSTRTPYPAAPPTTEPSDIPAITAPTAAANLTPTPSMTPRPRLVALPGENHGEVAIGDYQVWQYEGHAGELLTIRVSADNPANWAGHAGAPAAARADVLDTLVIVTAPDGRDLNVYNSGGGMVYAPAQSDDIEAGVVTDSLVDSLALPADGVYQILVSGSGYRTGGGYTMVIESRRAGAPG